jgi:crotonobetainyl-CoA:carnitine CoA-transferase CaiB-like acyl-CoA transferase
MYYRPYKTKDGYVVIGCLGPGPRARLREALQFTDPRYEPGFDPARLKEVAAELVAYCEGRFQERTTDEWIEFLDARDVAVGPLRFIEEMWADPQVAANGFLENYEHTLLGPLRGPSPMVRMSGTPTRIQRASPALGEHTEEVLLEAGFSDEQIAAFRENGVTN